MHLLKLGFLFISVLLMACSPNMSQNKQQVKSKKSIRFASYNVSMYGNKAGEVMAQLKGSPRHEKYTQLAKVIQSVRPDILVLMEVDYNPKNEIISIFNDQYLANGPSAINYPYFYQIPSNTGILAPIDMDTDGDISLPNDAYGFGRYPGQYASAILSKYPLDIDRARSFQNFLWKDMPNAALPYKRHGIAYYSEEVLDHFRLSSKNHIDIPVKLPGDRLIHTIISHPTPPVFDGPEDRNGRRNHDEIRLLSDYISNAAYLIDDEGRKGGLDGGDFVIMGDLNADPIDGDSYHHAIRQLIDHPMINTAVSKGELVPSSQGGKAHNKKERDLGDPSYDTSIFGMRIDYVLPSKSLEAIDSGVFWPVKEDELWPFLRGEQAVSDHFLVWVDIKL